MTALRASDIKGIKAVVIGLGRSGAGAATLLSSLGASVSATDTRKESELKEHIDKLPSSVGLFLGGHPDGILDGAELVVISPGVPMDIPVVSSAVSRGIEVIGELELAYMASRPLPFYAVTGTNGKSTTTTLLNLMFQKAGMKTLFGGNIGNAITGELLKEQNIREIAEGEVRCAVVEVSSFQLESIESFRPRGSAILNITPDHLDRYGSMEQYRRAKTRIFMNQKEDDFLVLNRDDEETMSLLSWNIKSEVYFFSRKQEVRGVYFKDGTVYRDTGIFKKPLIRADEIRIKGVHNLENAMAASAMALLAGVPEEAVTGALREFGGLEHRLEFVRELDGVSYINDSKGTNVSAVMKSLEGFDRPVILIAGGRDKAGDFAALRPLVRHRVKALVLIGEAKDKIMAALEGLAECRMAESMEEAVRTARSLARDGDAVLLSPACASFDMFKDYEDRGIKFKEAVKAL